MLKFQTPRKLWENLKVFLNTATSEKEPHQKVNTYVKEDEHMEGFSSLTFDWTNACSDLEYQASRWDKQ